MNNDELPSPGDPGQLPREVPPRQPKKQNDAPNFWAMVGIGVLLLFLCCFLCFPFRSIAPLTLGCLIAFISLFGRGYRGLFVGFAVPLGLFFLLIIAICGNSHSSL